MSCMPKLVLGASLILAGIMGFSGCASKETEVASLKRLLAAKQERIEELKLTRADMQRTIDLKHAELERQKKDFMSAGGGRGVWTMANRAQDDNGMMIAQPLWCQNATPETVRQVQRALKQVYYYHGSIDGAYGPQTRRAIASYQRAKGLAVGGMTFETLRSLGFIRHDQEMSADAH